MLHTIFNLRLQRRILSAFIILIIIPVGILFYYSYSMSARIILERNNAASLELLYQSNERITSLIDRMSFVAINLSQSDELINYLDTSKEYQITDYLQIQRIIDQAKAISLFSDFDISLISFNGYFYSTFPHSRLDYNEMQKAFWFKEIQDNHPFYSWMLLGDEYLPGTDSQFLGLGRMLIHPSTNRPVGLLVLTIEEENVISSMSTTNADESLLFIIDNTNELFIGPDTDMKMLEAAIAQYQPGKNRDFFNLDYQSKRYQVVMFTIDRTSWKFLYLTPYTTVIQKISVLRRNVTAFMLLLFTLFFIGAYIIIRKYTTPIYTLIDIARQVKLGDMDARVTEYTDDEIGQLSQAFDDMLDTVKRLMLDSTEKQRQLHEREIRSKELEYEMLQSKINPHFLFNTLNNIKWMATINKTNNVAEMIAALGSLLETSLGRKGDVISVKQEIKNVDDYVKLQKMAYGHKFSMQYHIDDSLEDFLMLHSILQPMVENAIIHGLVPGDGSGIIELHTKREEDLLILIVKDDGIGIDEATLTTIREHQTEDQINYAHIGISLTIDRIRLYYGPDYGIAIESTSKKGTSVKITIPIIQDESRYVQHNSH